MHGTARAVLRMGWALLVLSVLPHARAQRFPIVNYTEGNGLPSSEVRGIAQDRAGRIWFTTRVSTVSFDGKRWEPLRAPAGADRGRDLIRIDGRGVPWSTHPRDLQVARLEDGRWQPLPVPVVAPDCRIQAFEVLVPTPPYDVALGTSCGLLRFRDGAWSRILETPVSDLALADGELLAATEVGLAAIVFDEPTWEPRVTALPGLRSIAPDRCERGTRCEWLVGESWIGRRVAGEVEMLDRNLPLVTHDVRWESVADGRGGLLFGHLLALYSYRPGSAPVRLAERNGLIAGGARGLLRDREDNIWVVTGRGVAKIASLNTATYGRANGLFDEEVSAILARRDGALVFGHRGGLSILDETGIRVFDFRTPGIDATLARVVEMAEAPDGTVWIAGHQRGFGRLADGRLSWSERGLPLPVTSVVAHGEELWLTAGHRLWKDDGSGEGPRPVPGADGPLLRRVMVSPESGRVYALSMSGGLSIRRDDGGWERVASPGSPDLNGLYSVLEVSPDRLWVGTRAGLAEVRDGALHLVADPAVRRPVYFVVRDGTGDVWLGTDNGALRWDGERLRPFSVEQGLGGRETNRAAAVVDGEGHLWIGTTGGATVHLPELESRSTAPPGVEIGGLEASGTPIDLVPTELEPHRNDLSFSVWTIGFRDPDETRIATRLEGLESDWTPARTAEERIRYTNLRPGRYRLHVRARSADGPWSEAVTSPWLTIAAPFWTSAWFWVALGVAALGLVAGVTRYAYQKRYTRRLEREVERRVDELRRIEGDLARAQRLESIGLLAGGIAHDFNNLLTIIVGYLSLLRDNAGGPQEAAWADQAQLATARARDLTNQLLTFSRGGGPMPDSSSIAKVVHESATFALHGSGVRSDCRLPDDLHPVAIDSGQISQVFNNLLINAVQAMDGVTEERERVVTITGRNVDRAPEPLGAGPFVAITVQDRGPGIPTESLEHVFDPYYSTKESGSGLGLATAATIARRHGGVLTVESAPGEGARFTLFLPASAALQETEAPTRTPVTLDGTSVLVMDDDTPVRETVAAMLESLGCRVEQTADGEQAVARYRARLASGERFDVVLLDLTVPGGVGGEATIRRLRELDPEVNGIVVSGYSHGPVLTDHRRYGFCGAVRKPFRRAELAEALGSVVGSASGHG